MSSPDVAMLTGSPSMSYQPESASNEMSTSSRPDTSSAPWRGASLRPSTVTLTGTVRVASPSETWYVNESLPKKSSAGTYAVTPEATTPPWAVKRSNPVISMGSPSGSTIPASGSMRRTESSATENDGASTSRGASFTGVTEIRTVADAVSPSGRVTV
jgi:hypothetical protein